MEHGGGEEEENRYLSLSTAGELELAERGEPAKLRMESLSACRVLQLRKEKTEFIPSWSRVTPSPSFSVTALFSLLSKEYWVAFSPKSPKISWKKSRAPQAQTRRRKETPELFNAVIVEYTPVKKEEEEERIRRRIPSFFLLFKSKKELDRDIICEELSLSCSRKPGDQSWRMDQRRTTAHPGCGTDKEPSFLFLHRQPPGGGGRRGDGT